MPQYSIKSFSGGISEFDDKGIAGSFKFGKNLDIRKRKDTLTCGQATVSETTTNGLILWFIDAGEGKVLGFTDTGRIYERDAAGNWTLKYTGTGKIKGAAYWYKTFYGDSWKGNWDSGTTYYTNDTVVYAGSYYVATQTSLNKVPPEEPSYWSLFDPSIVAAYYWVEVDGSSDKLKRMKTDGNWSSDIEFIGYLTQTDWHTMFSAIGYLWIANGKNIATVSYGGDFSKDDKRFDIYPGQSNKCFIEYEDTLISGSGSSNSAIKSGGVWRHLYTQIGYIRRKGLPKSVNALVLTETILGQAGNEGEIYEIDFRRVVPKCRIEGGGYSNPGAVLNDGGVALFGISGGDNKGIWSFGRKNEKSNRVLNYDYAIDGDIGAIYRIGEDLLISCKIGDDYKVLKVDSANKAEAVYESLILKAPIHYAEPVVWETIKITLNSEIPSGTKISVEYKVDNGSWQTAYLEGGEEYLQSGIEGIFQVNVSGKSFQIRLTLTPSGNLTPEVSQVDIFFS